MELVDHKETFVAGVIVHAHWQRLFEEVPKAWQSLFQRAERLPERRPRTFVDVCLEASEGTYLQLVGFEISLAEEVPHGLRAIHVPAQRLLHHTHDGPVSTIATSFGAMYHWGKEHGVKLSEFKLDFGYTPNGNESRHELYVGLIPDVAWHYVDAG